jgi:hypothetical protein
MQATTEALLPQVVAPRKNVGSVDFCPSLCALHAEQTSTCESVDPESPF